MKAITQQADGMMTAGKVVWFRVSMLALSWRNNPGP